MHKIIITANNYPMSLPNGYTAEYRLNLFCKLIYYGYQSISIDGIESTPDQVKILITKEVK